MEKNDKSNNPDTSLDNNDECKWLDHVNLSKLILASNKITYIPKDVQLLDSLVTLDVNIKLKKNTFKYCGQIISL